MDHARGKVDWVSGSVEREFRWKPTVMSDERYDRERWQQLYRKVDNWEEMYARGNWTYLASLGEAPRFALIAGYIHRIAGRGMVLDAACGEGHLITYLDHTRITYRGFDLSNTAITNARARYPDAHLDVSTIEAFEPAGNERYDAIVFNEVLSHVGAPFETIDRFFAMLRPNGIIITSNFQHRNESSNERLFARLFDTEIAVGRYRKLASAEVSNAETGLRWRVTVLG